MPLKSPKCPHCESARLTPVTELGNISPIALFFKEKLEKKSWLGNAPEEASVDRGRICLDCGFVLMFCQTKHLEKLRGMETSLDTRGLES